jgi:hypothetical protein
MIIAALATLVKLNAAAVLAYCGVLAMWRIVNSRDRLRLTTYFLVVAGLLVSLVCVNLKTSGCPFYPSPIGCGAEKWSVGPAAAAELQTRIHNFALSSRHWQTVPLLVGAVMASLLAIRLLRPVPFVRHGLGLSWAGIALILLSGPSPRFGLGYFLWPVAIACAGIVESLGACLREKTLPLLRVLASRRANTAAVGAVVLGCAGWILAMSRDGNASELLYPRRMAAYSGDSVHVLNRRIDSRTKLSLQPRQVGSLRIWVPDSSDQCWDAPLPCTPAPTVTAIALRNPARGFGAGFAKIGPAGDANGNGQGSHH